MNAQETIRDLDAISMALGARLAQMRTSTIKRNDYLLRDAVMREVVEWRRMWDKNSSARAQPVAIETADLIARLQASIGDAECYEWKSVSVANIRAAIALLEAQPERVALSDENISDLVVDYCEIVQHGGNSVNYMFSWDQLLECARAILSTQADAPITQPLIAEATREDLPLKDSVLNLYQAPFKFIHGYIQDAKSQTVADDYGKDAILRIRGWGRINYMPEPEKLQDAVGEHIAAALTAYWSAATAAVKRDDVAGDAKDAERYRFLRLRAFMTDHSEPNSFTVSFFNNEGPSGEFFDGSIDAAISASTKEAQ